MKILSIDTTSMHGSASLSDDERLVAQVQRTRPKTHASHLMMDIEGLLSKARWGRGDIDAVVVAVGPGSFTGLRIGIATAKGMALGFDIPLVGVSSLEALAQNGRDGGNGVVVSLIDARRGELYAAAYRFGMQGKHVGVMGECVLSPDALIQKLGGIKGDLILVGDGVLAYKEFLGGNLGERAMIPEMKFILPQAHNLALLAIERLKRGQVDDLAGLVPNYIRRSDAEIGFGGNRAV